MRRSIDSFLLWVCAALMPSVSSPQTVANAPVDAALSVVAYVETRVSAAEAARATTRRMRNSWTRLRRFA